MYRFYLYKFLIDFWVIVPVIVPFYKAHGMSATRILTIQAAFSLSQLLFEIPSGYLSDVIGRRRTLILAALCMVSGIGLYTFAEGFWWFIAAEMVLGIAGALRSGTDSALLYEYLHTVHDEQRYRHFEGCAEFWSRSGTAVSAVAGGLLGAYTTLYLPFYCNMVTAGIMVLIGISLQEPQRSMHPAGNPFVNILHCAVKSISNPALLAVMLRMGLFFSTGVTAIWGYFLLYRQYRIPLFWHGFIFAGMQLASAFGARHAGTITTRLGDRTTGLLLILPGVCCVVSGSTKSPYVVLLMVFLQAVVWGMSTPFFLEKMQHLSISAARATTLSVGSMIGRILAFTIGPLFGYFADHLSIGGAFVIMGIFYCIALPITGLLSVAPRTSAETFLP